MSGWKISADTGGTFTDCLLESPDGTLHRGKVLSSGRLRTRVREILADGSVRHESFPLKGTDWLEGLPAWIGGKAAGKIKSATGECLQLEEVPNGSRSGDILEVDSGWEAPVLAMHQLFPGDARKEATELSFRLGTTKGTNALLENKGAKTALFLTKGFEHLLLIRDQKRPDLFARAIHRPSPLTNVMRGIAGRIDSGGKEYEPLDEEALETVSKEALECGCDAAAVCFINSWRNPEHEERAARILKANGFKTIRTSASIRPLIKYLDRTDTTVVDATLSPVMDAYLDKVQGELGENPLWVMTSAGGLVSRARFHAVDSLISGPAGGVLGAVTAGRQAGLSKIIGLDMGGTSTDVSRWKDNLELRQHVRVGGARLLTPAMPIETVAAGGGSICGYDGERLFVGPESAGADPGPACYGAGGPLCLTDIHLLLGRVDPDGFSIPIQTESAEEAIREVAKASGEEDWQSLAEGFLTIATERMGQAIRQVSLREGEDPAGYGLVAFGGAGGLHACRVAELLGMKTIIFPSDAGILSARGIHFASRDVVVDKQFLGLLDEKEAGLKGAFAGMEKEARAQLQSDGVDPGEIDTPLLSVFLRLKGQESSLSINWNEESAIRKSFREKFVAVFGYFPEDAELETVKLRLRLQEQSIVPAAETFPKDGNPARAAGSVAGYRNGQSVEVPVFDREQLETGDQVVGPAILRDPFSTCFVEKGWLAIRGNEGSLQVVPRSETSIITVSSELANVEKTLVLNRLEGLVEEMGEQLRRTALSTNIRERLDFSCALLDSQGRLLVNAPHIPVHLGAMGLCVREAVKALKPGPGDVIVTNHPGYGGSHLPDVTVISALFDDQGKHMGYLANRAHHAEWGGRTPGSMPADATTLVEEGVVLEPQWIVRKGEARIKDITDTLMSARYPSRAITENRIDLEAQLASLNRGAELFNALLRDYNSTTISDYFSEMYRMASDALADTLRVLHIPETRVVEKLDDGHVIQLSVKTKEERLYLDFEGTGATHPGNLNATPAIVRSAILYVLRLLVDKPMPLNEGLLENVELNLPRCFLNPEFPGNIEDCPAVVGGNVETSQRLVDALIRAFALMAAGQGTMNNLLFGNDRFGYYETIGGGAGASDGCDGASGLHVHMTNTAITDPEILEQRFPVRCREFSIRKNSGGAGRHRGGDGLVRVIQFLEPVSVSVLSQNRKQQPRGAHGGDNGSAGRQWIIRKDGTREALPGIAQVELGAGDCIRIETPGGGGWG